MEPWYKVAVPRREVREEAGLECDSLMLRGTISWPGFGKHGEDWFGFIWYIQIFSRNCVPAF